MKIRSIIKLGGVRVCRAFGLEAWSRNRLRNQLLVLCYHGVVEGRRMDRFGYENTVDSAEFAGHLEYLGRHFRPVTATDVATSRRSGKPLPERAVLVTFDDGYRNNLNLASEILRRAGVPAIFFVSSGYIGTRRILWPDELMDRLMALKAGSIPLPAGGEAAVSETDVPAGLAEHRLLAVKIRDLCKRMDAAQSEQYLDVIRTLTPPPTPQPDLRGFMTWDEVRALRAKGFEIGAHTIDHPILTRVAPDRLRRELTESRHTIERELGEPCPFVAYPNGGSEDVSPQVLAAARDAGYKLGFTLAESFSQPAEDPLSLSRLCVQGHLPLSYFRFRASGAAASLKHFLAGRAEQ